MESASAIQSGIARFLVVVEVVGDSLLNNPTTRGRKEANPDCFVLTFPKFMFAKALVRRSWAISFLRCRVLFRATAMSDRVVGSDLTSVSNSVSASNPNPCVATKGESDVDSSQWHGWTNLPGARPNPFKTSNATRSAGAR